MLFFGAVASFLTMAMQRHRMAAARPEQYLSLWQAQASRRRSNPFLYLGRHTEFLIRTLLHALSGPCVRTFRCDLHGIHRRRGRGEHRLADSPLLILHIQPGSNASMTDLSRSEHADRSGAAVVARLLSA